jgi:hypothetical protein
MRDPLRLFKVGWLTAWVLGVVAVIAHGVWLSLILPAGVIITTLGSLAAADYRGMRQALDTDMRSQSRRALLLPFLRWPERGFGRFETFLVVLIGVGWTGMGIGIVFLGMR